MSWPVSAPVMVASRPSPVTAVIELFETTSPLATELSAPNPANSPAMFSMTTQSAVASAENAVTPASPRKDDGGRHVRGKACVVRHLSGHLIRSNPGRQKAASSTEREHRLTK